MEITIEQIPAFSMWKTFADTMPALIHIENNNEKVIRRLVDIITSHECRNIFIYENDPGISIAENEVILKRYTNFTVWLIGRFFCLLSCPKLKSCHKLIVEAQQYILEHLSRCHLHVYAILSGQYVKVLHQLTQMVNKESYGTNILLNAFQMSFPNCDINQLLNLQSTDIYVTSENHTILLEELLKIIQTILIKSFKFSIFSTTTVEIFNDLLRLLEQSDLRTKCNVIEVIVAILPLYKKDQMNVEKEIEKFYHYLYQIVFIIYSDEERVTIEMQKRFEQNIITLIQQITDINQIIEDIAGFLLEITCKANTKQPSMELQIVFKQIVKKLRQPSSDVQTVALQNHSYLYLYTLIDTANWMNICHHFPCESNENCLIYLSHLTRYLVDLKGINRSVKIFKDDSILLKILNTLDKQMLYSDIVVRILMDFNILCDFPRLFLHLIDIVPMSTGRLNNQRFQNENTKVLCTLKFIRQITTSFVNLNVVPVEKLYDSYLKMSWETLRANNLELQIEVIESVPYGLLIFSTKHDVILTDIYIPILKTVNSKVLKCALECFPTILYVLTSSKLPEELIQCGDDGSISVHLQDDQDKVLRREVPTKLMDYFFRIFQMDLSKYGFIKYVLLETLSNCIKYIPLNSSKYSAVILKCMVFLVDKDPNVRQSLIDFIRVIFETLGDNQIKDSIYGSLLESTKRALLEPNLELQETIVRVLDELNGFPINTTHLTILIYMTTVWTSKYPFLAANQFIELAQKHQTSMLKIYKEHRRNIIQQVTHLSCVNYEIQLRLQPGVEVTTLLQKTLSKLAVTIGFFNAKDFIQRECQHLLPPFVLKTHNNAQLSHTILREFAKICNLELEELLSKQYGSIYLHCFLTESNEEAFNQCMQFVEEITQSTGPILRKRNFHTILNGLMLHFYKRQEQVCRILTVLKCDDNRFPSCESTTIQEYLKPHLLGLLLHFDFKLMKHHQTEEILYSFLALLKFIGPDQIVPLYLKIMAMLRNCSDHVTAEFYCEIWITFLHCCNLSTLGPHLATIFATLLPLKEQFPNEIRLIFQQLKDANPNYIKDLFVVKNSNIVTGPLKEQLEFYVKYMIHDTTEVRIKAFDAVRLLLADNRKELEKMIVSYDGIDPIIVKLIEIFVQTSCQCNFDRNLQIMCADLMGEMGAIEPSQLPRKLNEKMDNTADFAFLMDDDSFVVNTLLELLRAVQAETNAYNMDRFSVAIQQFLKYYKIGPVPFNTNLWNKFNQTQQQLMKPWLSSKYIIKESVKRIYPIPLYGTTFGTTFKSWLFNWTCSIINSFKDPDKQSLMTDCLPAMKRDYRILINFLPYILLHSLLQNDQQSNYYVELNSIISSFNQKEPPIPDEVNKTRPFGIEDSSCSNSLKDSPPSFNKQIECIKVCFILLDFLERWLREYQYQKNSNEDHKKIVEEFLKLFCKLQLARCAFVCEDYPRSLMYLETYMLREDITSNKVNDNLPFLTEIYAKINEPDGVVGCTALQQHESTLEQRILALETAGKLTDTIACYEHLKQPLNLSQLKGLVDCYLELDNANTALSLTQNATGNLLVQHPLYAKELYEMQCEPLWRLGRFDELNDLLENPLKSDSNHWGTAIGRLLQNFRNYNIDNTFDLFTVQLEEMKRIQISDFGTTTINFTHDIYQSGYHNHIVRLHILNELDHLRTITITILNRPNDCNVIKNVLEHLRQQWNLRLKIVQQSVRTVEQIMRLRCVGLEQLKWIFTQQECYTPVIRDELNKLLGECWLKSAKTARKSGLLQQAFTYVLKAEQYEPECLFLEKAKLHWMREEYEQALAVLKFDLSYRTTPKVRAEAKLLYAFYNDCISNVDTETNIANYKDCVDTFKEWEKSLLYLAQFYDKIFQSKAVEDRHTHDGSNMQLHMINCFGKSLQYGSEFVYQSMPRLLSIWFDYGTYVSDANITALSEHKTWLLNMTKLVDKFLESLPSFTFFTAFSQLISRICHPQREVYIELKSIIVKMLLQYPQQSLWMMLSVIKSGYALRSKRCTEILSDNALKLDIVQNLIRDFTCLAEKLMELCNKDVAEDVNTFTVSQLVRSLPRLLIRPDFSQIIVPIHRLRKLILPNPIVEENHQMHNPFPHHYIYIASIENEVTILKSLQRPRKIVLRGSDGKSYIQMLKARDDLRKDFRLMEFNDVVNQLLIRDADCRQRRLNIRLYSVVPLNEECGLIEWVPNLVGLRQILLQIYQMMGCGMPPRQLKGQSCSINDPLTKKRSVFLNVFITKHPPVLGEWFRRIFPDPQSWFGARSSYIHTTAVISIVGYILGLGDRHGENILLDSFSGDTVHVDFNCLFNKGETFEWPERVPFRLTHNMTNAMGPLGVEGAFLKSCICTLKVLRANITTLMSIVTPFVYDPLVSWPRTAHNTSNTTERINEKAVEYVKNIQLRLEGVIKTRTIILSPPVPLSVDGQTNYLIKEATSVNNLCQMYVGWGPFL